MHLTNLQIAAIENALRTLERKPDYSHGMTLIRRVAGQDAVSAIRRLHKELVDANKATSPAADLSADAQDYVSEVRKLIALGRSAQNSGNSASERRVSEASERLEESFDERVPEVDRPKFLRSEGDFRTWDDRWSFMEFRPPLLRREFTSRPIEHPMNIAQRTVLADLARTNREQNLQIARNRLKSTLKLVRSGE